MQCFAFYKAEDIISWTKKLYKAENKILIWGRDLIKQSWYMLTK